MSPLPFFRFTPHAVQPYHTAAATRLKSTIVHVHLHSSRHRPTSTVQQAKYYFAFICLTQHTNGSCMGHAQREAGSSDTHRRNSGSNQLGTDWSLNLTLPRWRSRTDMFAPFHCCDTHVCILCMYVPHFPPLMQVRITPAPRRDRIPQEGQGGHVAKGQNNPLIILLLPPPRNTDHCDIPQLPQRATE